MTFFLFLLSHPLGLTYVVPTLPWRFRRNYAIYQLSRSDLVAQGSLAFLITEHSGLSHISS
jgi:hypothetical protein